MLASILFFVFILHFLHILSSTDLVHLEAKRVLSVPAEHHVIAASLWIDRQAGNFHRVGDGLHIQAS